MSSILFPDSTPSRTFIDQFLIYNLGQYLTRVSNSKQEGLVPQMSKVPWDRMKTD
ncbi:hypothetical protein MBM_03492 [Drepanopeziza brunnea f. sp. 'multigermtubi' MB_m1]|uniref:Uncharacterized protein n=1 Tax=Marssonina brunnea f. sp. multigermtubi (strain MB_m1) TaxID=1072389 RepID=K1Y060_MARBU|nr:uncharacterized protein MBM_03492 [Drepanopeziza brunnea f. sp. 'multigermtubi' MB_m1]EKD18499.1 hypothetical protein MBM_03492 [Drepanopeziza brunnea f. sp. 'multigermtubi' MB_m1]